MFENQRIKPVTVEKQMQDSFMEYSMSVIVSRALPDVRDGLKPVHRRILYTMFEDGLFPDKKYLKSATTVGDVLGRYHPHGDASVYDALVRLAQDFSMRYPLVDGQGNFGSVDGDPAAAYRYTEAKLAKITMELLSDINKDTIKFDNNYDDRLKEPTVLPSRYPNLLVNGSTGIAVGMATNIPPHNLREVIDCIYLLLENPDAGLEDLMGCIKGPDFPTGGIIMGRSGIRAAYATGRGKITLRAATNIEEIKGRQCIIVNELPYMVNKARLIEAIAGLHRDKRVEGIHDLRDESDRDGMRIVIELKKDAIPQVVLNRLFSYSQLQDTVGVIMLALVNGQPKLLTLKQMLDYYIEFQEEVIRRRTAYDLKKAKEREHILQGLVIAIDNLDEVFNICRSSQNIAEQKERLKVRFGLSEAQAEAITQMTMGRLSGMERQKIEDELEALVAKVADLEDILAHEERVKAIIKEELEVIREKYGDPRRTAIESVSGEMDIEDLIPREECVITYTNIGYIKRQPTDDYKLQRRGGRGVNGMKQRDEDFVNEMFIVSTHDNVIFLSNLGVCYKLKGYEVPEGGKGAKGTNIVNLLPLKEGEKIAAMLKIDDFSAGRYLVMVTAHGKIKRTGLEQYRNVRKNGLIATRLEEGDEIAGVRLTDGHSDLIIATRLGAAIRIGESSLRVMGRTARGVKAIQLRPEDRVVSFARAREGATVLTISDKGLGRRTLLSEYRLQNRGGYGLRNYKGGPEKGYVCGIKVVDESDDMIMVSSGGVVIRLRVADIPIKGRYAYGVITMRVGEDEQVVSFTRAEHDDSADVAQVIEIPEDEEAEAQDIDELEILNQNLVVEDSEDPEEEDSDATE